MQPAQNQLKSDILFHENGSLRDFYIHNDFAARPLTQPLTMKQENSVFLSLMYMYYNMNRNISFQYHATFLSLYIRSWNLQQWNPFYKKWLGME